MKNKKAFTLMEIMITVVLIGVIAGFAIPNYERAMNKARERDAIVQLSLIHSACQIYKAQHGGYFVGNLNSIPLINTTLKINVISNTTTYEYTGNANNFLLTATLPNGAEIQANHLPLFSAPDNPCCSGTCFILSLCP